MSLYSLHLDGSCFPKVTICCSEVSKKFLSDPGTTILLNMGLLQWNNLNQQQQTLQHKMKGLSILLKLENQLDWGGRFLIWLLVISEMFLAACSMHFSA